MPHADLRIPGARALLLLHARRPMAGQGMVEYGLILILVAVAVIGALIALQGPIESAFNAVINGLQGGNPV